MINFGLKGLGRGVLWGSRWGHWKVNTWQSCEGWWCRSYILISTVSISIWMKEKKRSGGAHGWVLGSRNSCEHMHMCFLPFVLCHVGPFFIYMPSSLTLTILNGSCIFYFSSQIYWLYNILFTFSFTSRYSFIYIPPFYSTTCAFASPSHIWIESY